MPIPRVLAVSDAMASASPVTILTSTPIWRAVAMVALASTRGGSNRGSTPRNCQAPFPSARATPRERNPRAANSLTAWSTLAFTCLALAESSRITWGAPLVTLNAARSRPYRRLGALADRLERLEVLHVVSAQRLVARQATENRQVDGVVVVGARRQRRVQDDLVDRDALDGEGIAERQLVLGQGAGLVRAEHVHPGQLLDRHEPADDGLLLREQARADGHRHRQHRRHRDGNRRDGEHERELQCRRGTGRRERSRRR